MDTMNYPGFLNDDEFLKEEPFMSSIRKYNYLYVRLDYSQGPSHLRDQLKYLDTLHQEAKKESSALLDIVTRLNSN